MTAQTAPAPNWGVQGRFIRPDRPAFWLFTIVLGLTGLATLSDQLAILGAAPTAWITTIILIAPLAIPLTALVYYLDLYEREPLGIMVAALLWGGVAATTFSMYTNTPLMELIFKLTGDAEFTARWSAALTAPWVEELYKGIGIILLVSIAREELDDLLDGFVWGAMVGIGFQMVENVLYFINAYSQSGDLGSLFTMFLIRVVGAGPYSHFLYSGLFGIGVAYWTLRKHEGLGRRLLVAGGAVLGSIGFHFFWNSPLLGGLAADGSFVGFALYVTVKGLPVFIGVTTLVRLARRRERRWFASYSAHFHDDGAITQQELEQLSGLRARRRARKAAGGALGKDGERLQGRLQRAQIMLAMQMAKHGSEAHPEVAAQQQQVMALKAELAALAAGRAGGGAPVAAAGPAPSPAPAAAWAPTHAVPAEGLQAWATPDPTQPPIVNLAGSLPVAVAERAGDWARVVASNGWTGWVDGRRLAG